MVTVLEIQIPVAENRALAAQLVVAVLHAAIHDVIPRHRKGPSREAAIELTKSTVTAIARA